MLLKYITCTVPEHRRTAFSQAQQMWRKLDSANGFITQFGGWDESNNAVIVAIWKEQMDYDLFMSSLHDQIVERNEQSATYEEIKVEMMNVSSPIKSVEAFLGELPTAEIIHYASQIAPNADLIASSEKCQFSLSISKKERHFPLKIVKSWMVCSIS